MNIVLDNFKYLKVHYLYIIFIFAIVQNIIVVKNNLYFLYQLFKNSKISLEICMTIKFLIFISNKNINYRFNSNKELENNLSKFY